MQAVESVMCITALCLCIVASITDLRTGRIGNKMLLVFLGTALVLDTIYYGLFCTDRIFPFAVNLAAVISLSLLLFFTHSFAGGDCKMACVVAALYPAQAYLQYAGWQFTLVFAIGFAIFYGYIYLVVSSVIDLLRNKQQITVEYLRCGVLSFIKPYITSLIYISTINSILFALHLEVNEWILRGLFMGLAWVVCRYNLFSKPQVLLPTFVLEIILSICIGFLPISLNPLDYSLVAFLLCARLLVRNGLYQSIPVGSLKKGMILSIGSSLLMQGSRIAHIPTLSTEDLRSRLSDEEVEAVGKWCRKKKIEEITILKKIPFAIFISLGFVSYYALWRLIV